MIAEAQAARAAALASRSGAVRAKLGLPAGAAAFGVGADGVDVDGTGAGLASDQGAGGRDDAAPPVDAFNKMSIQVCESSA
jgi:hypothetical protein